MRNEKIVVTDDWTRNWQARIAIKITAIFLRVIILSGFVTVVFFTKDLDVHIEQEISHDLDGVAHRVQSALSRQGSERGPDSGDGVRLLIEEAISQNGVEITGHAGIVGFRFTVAGQSFDFGTLRPGLASAKRQIVTPGGVGDETAELEAFFLPAADSTKHTRQELIITVVVVLLLFGMLLSLTIQNVLAKPLQAMMDAIQQVSNGDLNLRLDVSRKDEFGHLSRFFNQMLTGILAYIGMLLFEGVTNLRVPILVSRFRYGADYNPGEGLSPGCARIPFDAERALRVIVAAMLVVSYVVYRDQAWFFPWFIGSMLLLAGITNICPMVMALRWSGFR